MTAREAHAIHNALDAFGGRITDALNTHENTIKKTVSRWNKAIDQNERLFNDLEKRIAILETQVQDLELRVSSLDRTSPAVIMERQRREMGR